MSDKPDPNGLPVLLLIHGTSAADEEDAGERWWQEGSDAWQALHDQLDGVCDVPDSHDQEIFHWSGANGERARHQAAIDLLETLLEYERQGRPYHLIGHSHGGSVIWVALQMAVKRRWIGDTNAELLKLKGLRSWATVGTPFLQFVGSVLGGWQGKVVGVLTLLFVVGILGFLTWHLNHRFQVQSHFQEAFASRSVSEVVQEMQPVEESARHAATQSEKIALRGREQVRETGERFGQAIGNEVLRVSNVTQPNTVFDWILLGVIGVIAPILASSFYVSLRAVRLEARAVLREGRVKNEAFLEFGEKWLGIWSAEDEAINGLRGSLRLSGRVIPRIHIPKKRVFLSDRVVQFHRFIVRNLIAPVYNRVLAPSGDDFLWLRISKSAQGHDRPGCAIFDVTEGPIPLPGLRYPGIPSELDRGLIETANARLDQRAGTILSRARSALSQYAWGSTNMPVLVGGGQGAVMHGDELVHTSYFHHPEVISLLATHIRQSDGCTGKPVKESPEGALTVSGAAHSWDEWLANFKERVRAEVLQHEGVTGKGLPRLGQPNWMAVVALCFWFSMFVLPPLYLYFKIPHPFALISGLAGVPSTGTIAGLTLVLSILFFPLIGFILSLVAARRADFGALRGTAARSIIQTSIVLALVASVGFGGWYVWDRYFSKADRYPDLAVGFRDEESTLITATGSSIKLRHMATGRVRATINTFQIRSVATSADQNKLAYATESTIHLIDIKSRKASSVVDAYGVKGIALSPNGSLLASGHGDGSVHLWYTPTASRIGHFLGHRDWVRTLAFSPSGDLLASGSDDRTIRLWNIADSRPSSVLTGQAGPLRSLAFSPDGQRIASGAMNDEMVRIWDVSSGQMLSAQSAHPLGVRCLAYNPGGNLLASGGDDRMVRVWNVTGDSINLRHSLLPHPNILSSVAFDRSGAYLASRCRSHLVRLTVPETGRQVRSLTDVNAEVHSVAFTPDSEGILIGDDDVHARLVNPDTGRILASIIAESPIEASAASPRGDFLATSDGFLVHLWDTRNGDLVRNFGDETTRHTDDVFALAFSPDGNTLASGSDDNRVLLWDVESGALKATLSGHTDWVRSVAFSPDGKTIASGSHDQSVRVWNAADGTLLRSLDGHTGRVKSLAFRSDGGALASGGLDDFIRLWNPATGEPTSTIPVADQGPTVALAWEPGGGLLASAGADNLVRIWNAEDASLVLTLTGHTHPVTSLAYDPDGSRIASGSRDYTVRVWDSVTGALLNIIGDRR